MHIAIICEEFPPAPHGGTGSSYADLAACLTQAGVRVSVIGISATLPLDRPRIETQGEVRVFRLPRASKALRTRLGSWEERHRIHRWLKRIHRETPIDLVEASDYHGWSSEVRLQGVPVVVRIRGANFFFDAELGRDSPPLEKKYELKALQRADFIAAVSEYAATRTLELAGLSERFCEVIPNAVDTDYFSPSDSTERDPGLILFVNSVGPRKGIETLLKACNTVLRRHPDARLAVIGKILGPDGGANYHRELIDLLDDPLRERVSFKGRLPRSEVRDWLRRASVCCYPSLMETFGIAPLEAMACACPTIYSKLGPGPELIDDGVNGLLCDPGDPGELAEQLARLLESRETALRLGQEARHRAVTFYSISTWQKRNLEYYQYCIEQRSTPCEN